MEGDRKLLELAAKAAGLVIDKSQINGGGESNDGFNVLGDAMLDWHNNVRWNPLTDDGDALRLAVKLDFKIFLSRKHAIVTCWVHGGDTVSESFTTESGKTVAVRLAIVRAAAAIGEAMS